MNFGYNLKKTSALFLGLLIGYICVAQSYATLPFSDDLSSGSLGASMSWSQTGSVGNVSVVDASGGWPQFGTCSGVSCANVGSTSGNGLMIYNTSNPAGGNNEITLDLHLDLDGAGSVELQFAIVDYGSGTFDTVAVWLSDDGGSSFSYNTKIPLNQAPHNDGTWNELTYDITSMLAAEGLSQTDEVVFRMAAMLQRKGNPSAPKQIWNDQAIYFDNFKYTELAALPIELISFTGTKVTGGRFLEWETAAEINNSHYVIQRSTNGTSWNSIGEVSGNGTTQDYSYYNFLDSDPMNETVYYRLKQVDTDGTFSYSHVVSFGSEGVELSLNVMNNGASPTLSFSGVESSVDIKIYGMDGKLVLKKGFENLASGFDYNLDLLANGNYMVVAQSGMNKISEKVTVVK